MKQTITTFALCAMLFALCFPVKAQQPTKVPRIGYLTRDLPFRSTNPASTRSGRALRELGYIERSTTSH